MTIEDINKDNYLLYKAIRGSQSQGLATENSDIDTVGIFCAPLDWNLGIRNLSYQDLIESEKKDDILYELNKFILGLSKSNPSCLEALFLDSKYIQYKNPILDPLWNMRDQLLTKACYQTFYHYGLSQIIKAKGLKKKINIDPRRVERRKSILEFCIVPKKDKDGSLGLLDWMKKYNLKQEYCGATRLSGGNQFFSLYYDYASDKDMTLGTLTELKYGQPRFLGFLHIFEWLRGKISKIGSIKYRGLLDPNHDTTQIRCSEISKIDSKHPIIAFQFNENAFKDHCTEFKQYWEWVEKRNPERFNLNQGYNFDSKNLTACVRYLKSGIEILQGKGFKVDRTEIDRDFLLAIKHHKISYSEIMTIIEGLKEEMRSAFENSTLPDAPDIDMLNKIQIDIRKQFYKLCSIP